MSGFKGSTFTDRATASTEAKKALLERFKAKPAPDDPEVAKRREERSAIAAAREVRMAERRRQKEIEAEQKAVEEAARVQAEQLRLEEEARHAVEQAEREEAAKAERKAIRDAKYAARKAKARR